MTTPNPLEPNSGYKVPKGNSPYLTFEIGDTEFLPLSSALIGFEYWTKDGKPVRLTEAPSNPASLPNIRPEVVKQPDGSEKTIYKCSHFWAFAVIDYDDGRVKVLKITQNSIQKAIQAYVNNPKWGTPVMRYTLTVNRTGSGFDTEYAVMANPTSEVPEAFKQAWEMAQVQGFSLERWFKDGEVYSGPHFEASYAPAATPAEQSAPGEAASFAEEVRAIQDIKPGDIPF